MCRRKISFFWRRRKKEKEKEKIFRKGIDISYNMDEKQSGEGKGKKLEKESIFC